MATLDKIKNYDLSSDGMGLPINILRGNPIPLDNSSLFLSKQDAEVYAATSSIAYIGQIIVAIEDDIPKAYIIKDKDGTLEEIGSGNKLPSGIDANSYLNVQKVGRVATLTATDSLGTTTVTVTDGKNGVDGIDGVTPYINEDGYWVVNNVATNIPAQGEKGERGEGFKIDNVYDTIEARDADADEVEVGQMVVVAEGGRLFLKSEDGWVEIGDFSNITTIKGDTGEKGEQGSTPIPTLEEDGKYYWYIDGESTGVMATGIKGDTGDDGYSPLISINTENGLTTVKVSYKDIDDTIKTNTFRINNGYVNIKTVQRKDTGWYSTKNYSDVTFNYLDENGELKSSTLKVYNGKTPTLTFEKHSDKTTIYLNGHYNAENNGLWEYEDKTNILNGLNPKLTTTKLADGVHRFTYTNYKRDDDDNVVVDNDTSGYVDINTGYCPTIDVTRKNSNLTNVKITDLNNTNVVELSSAEISIGEKQNGKVTITTKDGYRGEQSVTIFDGEFAYDDTAITKRVKALEDDFDAFVGFDTKIITKADLSKDGEKGIIYLVPDSLGGYSEYIWVNNSYVSLGTSATTLSEYVKKTDKATATTLGIVKPDNTDLKVDGNGIISINNVPAASTTKVGGIKYDNQSLALNSSGQLAVKLSSEATNGLSYDTKGLYSQKINIATTKDAGIVKPDGTTVTVDADGTIHTKVKGGASKTPGNTLSEKDDGLYVGTGSDKELGSVKVDGSSISATSGEISVKIDSTDSDNALISGTNGLSIAKASDTKYGMVKIDNKTIGLDKNGVTQVKLSAITETYRQENIDFGESYDYTNNLRVNAPYKITITPKTGTDVSPSVSVYHESMITGVRKLVKTFTSGTYSDTLPKETTIIVTNNADASSTLSILNNPDENIITVEKDGLMVDRYKNLATTYTPGFVIPDNDTVTVDGNGVISSTIGANSVSYRTRNLIQLIRTYESLSVLPTVGKANLIYKIPVNSSDPETLYKEYIWDGSKYVDTGVIGEGNEDGIYIDEDDTVPIATYVDEGKVRPDGNTIILENPDDVNNGTILVNTEVIATQQDIIEVNNSID